MKVMDNLRDKVVHACLYPKVPDAVPVVAHFNGVNVGSKMQQLGYISKCSPEVMLTLFPDLQTKVIPAAKLTGDVQSGAGQQWKKPVGAERQTSDSGQQAGFVPLPLMSIVTTSAGGDVCGLMRDASQQDHCNNTAVHNQ